MMSSPAQARGPVAASLFTSVIRSELCAIEHQGDSRASSGATSLSGVQAGPLDVLNYQGFGEQWGGRDEGLIRNERADFYVVCAPATALLTVRQNSITAKLHRGSFAVVSTSQPFHARIRSEAPGQGFSAIHVRVPGPLLRRRIPNIDEVCGREMSITAGASRLMVSLFDQALREIPHMSEANRTRFGACMFDIVSDVVVTMAQDVEPRSLRPSAHERTVDCARAFIDANLSDPELDPGRIAEHCRVSTRFLHGSFASASSDSVAHFIRERRLQASREALRSLKLAGRTIIQIAGDWGFDDPAHFCRVYKARFGRTPREERQDAGSVIGVGKSLLAKRPLVM